MRSPLIPLSLALLLSGCSPELIGIEVLPPRSAPTCLAPTANSAAAGRGLLDVLATEDYPGSYVADLRFTGTGGRQRIDSLALSFSVPSDAKSGTKAAASDAEGTLPLGDVLLIPPEPDDVVVALVENVLLLPRSLAQALADDSELEMDKTRYETVTVTIEPVVDGEPIGVTSSFPIDVCRGCLVTEPSDEECPNGVASTGACRPGQDHEVWTCAAASSGGLFP